jgi:hypothetical protein
MNHTDRKVPRNTKKIMLLYHQAASDFLGKPELGTVTMHEDLGEIRLNKLDLSSKHWMKHIPNSA